MDPTKVIDRLYYGIVFNELCMMNESDLYHSIIYNSLLCLDLISYTENRTVSFLAGMLRVARFSVTLKVNELIRQGLVGKKRNEQDRRIYFPTVRPEILEEFRKPDQAMNYAVEQVKKQYTPDKMSRFCEMLNAFSSYYSGYCENTTRAKGDSREPESSWAPGAFDRDRRKCSDGHSGTVCVLYYRNRGAFS